MSKIIGIVFLFILLNFSIFPQNFWEKINSPTSKTLNSIIFLDSLNGWVAGDSGLIIHTSDGGENWETQFGNDSLNVVSIYFVNQEKGWASAWSSVYEPYGTFILTTTNGGLNWNSTQLRIGEAFVNSFYFLDTLTGFAVGYPGVFLRTTDGGTSWRHVNLDSSLIAGFPPYTVKFLTPQYGYACGGVRDIAGVVWRTTDGGLNWMTVVDSLSAEPFFTIQIFDSLHIMVMGGDPEYGASLVETTDGGDTWDYRTLGILWYPVDAEYRTLTEGWAPLGPKLRFLFTTDSGENWSEQPTPDSTSVTRLSFPDSIHGFGIGNNGDIIKYVYQKPNEIKSNVEKINSFNLGQNFPNPFNPVTTISYTMPNNGNVTLKVYNVLGKEIITLVNEYKQSGTYNVQFDGSKLSSGIYLYKIQAGDFTQVKKMILLK